MVSPGPVKTVSSVVPDGHLWRICPRLTWTWFTGIRPTWSWPGFNSSFRPQTDGGRRGQGKGGLGDTCTTDCGRGVLDDGTSSLFPFWQKKYIKSWQLNILRPSMPCNDNACALPVPHALHVKQHVAELFNSMYLKLMTHKITKDAKGGWKNVCSVLYNRNNIFTACQLKFNRMFASAKYVSHFWKPVKYETGVWKQTLALWKFWGRGRGDKKGGNKKRSHVGCA